MADLALKQLPWSMARATLVEDRAQTLLVRDMARASRNKSFGSSIPRSFLGTQCRHLSSNHSQIDLFVSTKTRILEVSHEMFPEHHIVCEAKGLKYSWFPNWGLLYHRSSITFRHGFIQDGLPPTVHQTLPLYYAPLEDVFTNQLSAEVWSCAD